tara:strand:+ start:1530 stop:2531 length:1002 start_codon:yes stop_codon:yes gene_type:complete
MITQIYKNCIFCNSSKLKLSKNQNFSHNFYTKSIKEDLGLSDTFFNKMKVYECQNCFIIQNSPWFSKDISFKIFNQIYGQHNRNWSNVINFFRKGLKPEHGELFNLIVKNFNVKNYCEFNAPFMGLMIEFFGTEYKKNTKFYKEIFSYTLKYLSSRQVSGLKVTSRNKKQNNSINYLKKINQIKKKYRLKENFNKSLLIDNSYLSWLYNDNYQSVNSRSLASELFDIKIRDFNLVHNTEKYDLFGIFHTLDHTHQPKKILNYALNNSQYVLVYCHTDESLEKQHLFSFTDKFLSYLKKRKIYFRDLTLEIKKNFRSKEMYIICSKFNKIEIKI